jgi:hypothetical protein
MKYVKDTEHDRYHVSFERFSAPKDNIISDAEKKYIFMMIIFNDI